MQCVRILRQCQPPCELRGPRRGPAGCAGVLMCWVRRCPHVLGVQVSSCAWCAGAPHVLGEDVTFAACGRIACVPTFTGCDVPIFAGCGVPPCRDACNASASCDNVHPPVSCADLGEVLPGAQVSSCAGCAGAPHVLGVQVSSCAGCAGVLMCWVRMLPSLLAESYPPLWGGAGGEAFACVPTFRMRPLPLREGWGGSLPPKSLGVHAQARTPIPYVI